MKVRICQLVCPSRHCIMAVSYHERDGSHAECVDTIEAIFNAGIANRRCGICGSEKLVYDDRPTIFDTMEEAVPALVALQHNQISSRAVLEALGMSYDSRQKP